MLLDAHVAKGEKMLCHPLEIVLHWIHEALASATIVTTPRSIPT